jgi:peptidyl-prolyl cis-trans isomerase SurA
VDLPAKVQLVRTHVGDLSPQQRSIVSHLEVGDVSEPLFGPDAVRLVVLCEKVEPSEGTLPNAEAIRQQLFAEKLELEAQKHLRNLRREAFIDIKGQ